MSKITNVMKAMEVKSPVKTAKAVKSSVATIAKEAPKASAADAMANQNKVLVKKYVKPEAEVIKLEKSEMKAASSWAGGDEGGSIIDGGRRGTWGDLWADDIY